MKRRQFLQFASGSAMAASLANLNVALANTSTAQDDYKALVCVFLYGGMDCHDTIIPYDSESYSQWANIRSTLLSRYATPRDLQNLQPLQTPARFGARQFALPPEMPGLQQLYQQGNMAVVGNVGTLKEITNASAIEQQTAQLPSRLFSHNDQQSTWMSGSTEGAQFGWAGLINDALTTKGVGNDSTFSTITMSGGELMITGQQTTPYHLIGGKAPQIKIMNKMGEHAYDLLNEHFRHLSPSDTHVLQQDMSQKLRSAIDSNRQFAAAIESSSQQLDDFPNSEIASQLKQVASVIGARNELQTHRQVFMVGLGGFDTHSEQANNLPMLQGALDQAITAFYKSLAAQGLSDKVTLFTASDFGRTLAVNGDGTDHGWGAHHFVVGGAVKGGTIYGDIPEPTLNHALDAGNGRLIPTLSVEQYAANFGAWMGLSEAELQQVFPTLTNFGERPVMF